MTFKQCIRTNEIRIGDSGLKARAPSFGQTVQKFPIDIDLEEKKIFV
jgi:hypothetical protein